MIVLSGSLFYSVIPLGKEESFMADVRQLIRAIGWLWFMRGEVRCDGCKRTGRDCG